MNTQKLPVDVKDALKTLATDRGFEKYDLETKPVSAIGDNSYGLVLQAKIACPNETRKPFFCVVKIAPINPARRAHMKVVQYYQREVFMYDHVLSDFQKFQEELKIPADLAFNAYPEKYFSSLKTLNEFIIFEDLAQGGYSQNSRKNLPTYDMTVTTLKALAKYHATSFAMQAKQPQTFKRLVDEIRDKDNLFTENMDAVSLEFAKKYIRKTKSLISEDLHRLDLERLELMQVVKMFEERFKEIALKAVNGRECAPYSVICHGDFWNNNILYRYDESHKPIVAKLIDFQMSRYSSPVLDIVHYLFACTEKDLRDVYFYEFIQIYHDTLGEQLKLFNLNVEKIYPSEVFASHLKTYGPYGFCMAIFAVPFFICDADDYPDLDQVAEAIHELSEGSDGEGKSKSGKTSPEMIKRSQNLVDEFELLNEKTMPHFKRRLTGVVQDLFKYNMVPELTEFVNKLDRKDRHDRHSRRNKKT